MGSTSDSGSRLRLRDYANFRVFSSSSDEARARRPTDVVLLVFGVVGLGIMSQVSPDTAAVDGFTEWVRSLPGLFNWVWDLCYVILAVWAIILLCVPLVARGRASVARDQILALALAIAASAWVAETQGDGWRTLLNGLDPGPPPVHPAFRLALCVAVVVTASPHLGMPMRNAGRWIVGLGTVSTLMLGASLPLGILAGACIGSASAAIVHLLFGSPGGRPTFDQIRRSLAEFGLSVTTMQDSSLSARGVALVEAQDTDGRSLLVKVHGRDAWDGQLMAVVWARLWYRGDAPNVSLDSRGQVEHEAFVTLQAERAGIQVLPVLAAGLSSGRDALAVVHVSGRSLRSLDGEALSDQVLGCAWEGLGRLHAANIAHGRLHAGALSVQSDGSVSFGDFASATATPTPEMINTDAAQLLATTALRVGPTRAVAAARRVVGEETMAQVLPLLQSAILAPEDGRELSDRDWDMEDLRVEVASAAGVEIPKLAPLRRITWAWFAKVGLLLAAVYLLMEALTGVDFASVSEAIKAADQAWIWAGMCVAVLATGAQAFSTMGAATVPLAFPVSFALQLAIQFMALIAPSSAARVGLNIRFFQKMGQTATTAAMIGVVDAFSGFMVQVALILGILVSGAASLDIQLQAAESDGGSGSSSAWMWVLAIVAVLVVVAVIAVKRAPKMRAFLVDRVQDIRAVARSLKSPGRAFELFAGNLLAQFLLALALGMCLKAFGESANMAELILVNTMALLFAGLMPVPGGVGVAEAALTAGLIGIGVPDNIAFSTAIVYRVVTFYLPPAWGWLGMRWLRNNDYV